MTGIKAENNAPQSDQLCGAFAVSEVARAKVNLTLEILGRRPDGYHELRSLVAFAAFGDELRFAPAMRFSLQIGGPFASALEGGNLVQAAAELYARAGLSEAEAAPEAEARPLSERAAQLTPHSPRAWHSLEGELLPGTSGGDFVAAAGKRLVRAAPPSATQTYDPHKPASLSRQLAPDEETIGAGGAGSARPDSGHTSGDLLREGIQDVKARPNGAFHLIKRIPVAAGLGGGSADAAAALRLLATEHIERHDLSALMPLAVALGADVPACLFSKPAIMTGVGERLRILSAFPPLPVVLVNPRLPLSTAAVFRELQAASLTPTAAADEPAEFPSIDAVIGYVSSRRNDLEAPARRLMPVIGTVLARLTQCPGALLARLSGSGPTCFALFRTQSEAASAANRLRADHPGWWIEASTLS